MFTPLRMVYRDCLELSPAQATPATTFVPWIWAAVIGEIKRKLFPLWGRFQTVRFRTGLAISSHSATDPISAISCQIAKS